MGEQDHVARIPDIELAKNRGAPLLRKWEKALAAGEIDEAQWYRELAAVITPAYLAGEDPRAQSGHSGGEAHWIHARSLIAQGIHKDGTFLDIGCASGYLMECMVRWTRDRGFGIEPYGLDIAPELADLARRRLPHWADRIYVGNALGWRPPRRFDFVRTGLEYVPNRRQRDLIAHLLAEVVVPGGRLIIGTYNEEKGADTLAEQVSSWGLNVAGRTKRPHYRDERLDYKVIWIET